MICPNCNKSIRVFKRSDGGRIKMRAPILLFDDDGTCAIPCPECRSEIRVPVTLDMAKVPKPGITPILVRPRRLTSRGG